ncbi:NAD(P)/FAD-dependent oxidoreductase [Nocardia testacea]|uniref:NAD(P)/FAD-dependent oxidoreductase n=1 Tax=Nocardia testacea TaxID=248551 RepID=UPI0002F2C37B|nr:FAD-dependent oxidoreductase [Nocardia testacea]
MKVIAAGMEEPRKDLYSMDILIVGGGFAGVWSAAAAARVREQTGAKLSITVVSSSADLVIRPRLYEADPERLRIPLSRILPSIGVTQVTATVSAIDTSTRTVSAVDGNGRRKLHYSRLVLAAGSTIRPADLPGSEYLHNVDTIQGATALDKHLRSLPKAPGSRTVVVVGAGFTGLEVATELVGRLTDLASDAESADPPPRVVLVERADTVAPDLGPGPRPAIEEALAKLGVEVRLGQTIASVAADVVRFTDGTELPAGTVVWTAGVQASPLTAEIPGRRDPLGRLYVNEYLQVAEAPAVLAAGDTAAANAEEPGRLVLQSCQHAIPLGKYAGYNAAADLLGLPLAPFSPAPYATCVDLGAAGAVLTSGWERTVVSTGDAAKQRKETTNRERIYPPLDAAELLRAADYQVGVRPPAAKI